MISKRAAALALTLLFPAGGALAQKETPPPPGKPKDFQAPAATKFRLDNGLEVTLVPYGTVPKVRVELAVLAGNAYEVPGGPHLVGHPAGQQIMHWFDIRGYAQSGAVTAYEDSVHGAPSIAWGSSVPAYSTLPSTTIVYILGARGYVW